MAISISGLSCGDVRRVTHHLEGSRHSRAIRPRLDAPGRRAQTQPALRRRPPARQTAPDPSARHAIKCANRRPIPDRIDVTPGSHSIRHRRQCRLPQQDEHACANTRVSLNLTSPERFRAVMAESAPAATACDAAAVCSPSINPRSSAVGCRPVSVAARDNAITPCRALPRISSFFSASHPRTVTSAMLPPDESLAKNASRNTSAWLQPIAVGRPRRRRWKAASSRRRILGTRCALHGRAGIRNQFGCLDAPEGSESTLQSPTSPPATRLRPQADVRCLRQMTRQSCESASSA